MRLTSTVREFDTSMELQQRSFTIAASAKMFHILSDSLYKHKELAIVRELTANAYDAHVRAKNTAVPFRLHLPTPLEPYFEIADYGTGLSEQGIYDLYTRYGGSDKTNTNDEIGGFGLGSKSPFAYTDQFSIESRYNGVAMQFHAYMNNHGMPTVAKIGEEPTTEHNGLTINVPVASQGYRAFAEAAARVLPYVPMPYDVNALPEELAAKTAAPEYIGEIDAGSGITIKLKKGGGCAVVMGIVSYPLDTYAFDYFTPEYEVLSHMHFDIYAPIGTFDIAASREALSYNQQTKDALAYLLPKVIVPACEKIKQQIEDAPTIFEAATRYQVLAPGVTRILQKYIERHKLTDIKNPIYQMHRWFNEDTTWQGQKIALTIPKGVMLRRIEKSWRIKPRITQMSDGNTETTYSLLNRTYSTLPHIYWKDKHGVPFASFFQHDATAKLPAWLFTGDRQTIADLFQTWGLDFDLLAEELPDVKRASGKGKKKSVYGAHRYETYKPDSPYNSQRVMAADLEEYGNRLVLHETSTAKVYFENALQSLKNAGMLTLDAWPVHAIIPASHSRVAEALVKAGAVRNITEYLLRGAVTVHRDRIVEGLAFQQLDPKTVDATLELWPFAERFRGETQERMFRELEAAGLEDVHWYLVRQQYLTQQKALGSYYLKELVALGLFQEDEIEREAAALKAIFECHKQLGEAILAKYPLAAKLEEAFRSGGYWYLNDWNTFHELTVHYFKSTHQGAQP